MKILYMLLKDLRIYARDRLALLINLAMPIVLIGILGASLGPTFSGDAPGISRFTVTVADEDKGILSRQLVDEVFGKELADIIEVNEMPAEEAKESVINDDAAAAVIIPAGFTQSVLQGNVIGIDVVANPNTTVSANLVYQVAQGYAEGVSSVITGGDEVAKTLAAAGIEFDAQEVTDISVQRLSAVQGKAVNTVSLSQEDSMGINSMQYYAAGMLAMFSLFMAMNGVLSILEERENYTLSRLYTAGAAKWQIMSSKLMSTWLSAFIQALIVILFTRYVYQVNWGGGLAPVLVGAAVVFADTGFAMIIAAVARTSKAAGGLSSLLIQAMSALGGSMIPLYTFPDFMKTISKGTINYWSLQGFLSLMDGQTISAVTTPLIILTLIGCAGLGIGVAALKMD